ncbi:hypothetical protein T492DRAFT_1087371 [Pavlovales sp. CCMP2436]|nr:hypothetical protein T492DRAFT_1087371 [Pavlovales sp. CCMP2436]|mmetsp:Transcript_32549/g.80950  ORF Transcript_32549/g.80950 Transcript_32549/m.80950 type:complete len:152 (-) Transcript_32549:345-800(-)
MTGTRIHLSLPACCSALSVSAPRLLHSASDSTCRPVPLSPRVLPVPLTLPSYYHALKAEIFNRFDASVAVTPLRDPGTTGNFEVRLRGAEPELIHSKTRHKQGKCTAPEEVDAVLDAIGAFLKASAALAKAKLEEAAEEAAGEAAPKEDGI